MRASTWILLALVGCTDVPPEGDILAIGDSFLEWNAESDASIPDVAGDHLNLVVANESISGALFLEGRAAIPKQWIESTWQWLILSGGGNDLNDTCQCNNCDQVMDELVSSDGQNGAIPELMDEVGSTGVKVAFVGYMDLPADVDDFAECRDELSELRSRLSLSADSRDTVLFIDASLAFGPDELDYYDDDLIHPSEQGSQAIGELVATEIDQAGI